MNRAEILTRLEDSSETWDLIVIGGGASGLGIAVDAATRGYRVALLEQADFGEGTSSKSTKLIHGGVRYLRSGEVSLVKESLRERGRLLENAPNTVKPLAFVVPAYRWYERMFYGAGLVLYDILAGRLGIKKTTHLNTEQTLEEIPNLSSEGLRGGTLYWDGQFDDTRLLIALARTAVANGAAVVNHVKVTGLIKENDKVVGVKARDRISEKDLTLRAKVVVNATGAFSDTIRKMNNPEAEEVITPSQGIHIVLEREFLDGDTGIMIPNTDDGRVLFAIPWHGRVLLGTTDTGGVPVSLHPKAQKEEVDYLIEHAARYLTKVPTHKDIRATFAGLRPLVRPPDSKGKATSKFSRSHSIFVSDSGMLTIAGGKWTTYRKMAEDAVDRVAELGGFPNQSCRTYDLTLLDESTAEEEAAADESLRQALDPELPYTMADVAAAVRSEMAVTLEDVLHRRTRCAFLDEAAAGRCSGKVEVWMEKETGKPVPTFSN